jgi:hypothetical protein
MLVGSNVLQYSVILQPIAGIVIPDVNVLGSVTTLCLLASS